MNSNRSIIWIGAAIIILLVAILGVLLYKNLAPQKMVIEVVPPKFYADIESTKIQVDGDIRVLKIALMSYFKNNGKYPDSQNYQDALIASKPQIIDFVLNDPFSNFPYKLVFSPNKIHFVIYSIGVSGRGQATIDDSSKVSSTSDAIWVSN
ncbi:MAG: hypothetical protein WC901_06030 [Candidatus Margulisiibacteriota bacterium]